jgi:general L-amino acid transport system permease protein
MHVDAGAMTTSLATSDMPTPSLRSRRWSRMQHGLFGNWWSAGLTVALAALLMVSAVRLFDWALYSAVWATPSGDAAACRAVRGQGACWALLREKHRFMLFATYPFEQHWRPALACLVLIGLYVLSTIRRLRSRAVLAAWSLGLPIICTLMWGGVLGLPFVRQELWGGLPATLLLSTFGIGLALPIGILLALGRQSASLPVIRAICVAYIELVRGVPLVSLLFMASFVFPIFLPAGLTVDKLLRAQIALIMFSAAYVAEVVRGGLQGMHRGQYEAAMALGFGYWRTHALIILPQALRTVIPALVNTSISLFKSTSLVLVIGLFDLLSAGKAAIVDPQWQSYGLEMYVVISLIYFAFCASMSRYSQNLEARLSIHRSTA